MLLLFRGWNSTASILLDPTMLMKLNDAGYPVVLPGEAGLIGITSTLFAAFADQCSSISRRIPSQASASGVASVCPEHGVERVRSSKQMVCPEHRRASWRAWARKKYISDPEWRSKTIAKHVADRRAKVAEGGEWAQEYWRKNRYQGRDYYDRVRSKRNLERRIANLDPRLQELLRNGAND